MKFLLFLFIPLLASANQIPIAPRLTTLCAGLLTHQDFETLSTKKDLDQTYERLTTFLLGDTKALYSDDVIDDEHDGLVTLLEEAGFRPTVINYAREYRGRAAIERLFEGAEEAAYGLEMELVPAPFWHAGRARQWRDFPRLVQALFSANARADLTNDDADRSFPVFLFFHRVTQFLAGHESLYLKGPSETLFTSSAVGQLLLHPPRPGADVKELKNYHELLLRELDSALTKTWTLADADVSFFALNFHFWSENGAPTLIVHVRQVRPYAGVHIPPTPKSEKDSTFVFANGLSGLPQPAP